MQNRTEERKEYEKKWRAENADRLREQGRAWRAENAEKLKAKKLEYYTRTKEEANARRRQDRIDNPEKYRTKERRGKSTRQNRIKNGFDDDLIEQRMREQDYKCALCLVPFSELPSHKIHADHCHKLGIARGFLCWHCNAGLGQFKDNPETIWRALSYLKRYSEVENP